MENRLRKFRVYCEQHNRWEYYSIGDLICGAATSSNGEGGIFKAETWSDFTGSFDKTGKEIYESDIVILNFRSESSKNYDFNCVVEFIDFAFRFKSNDAYSKQFNLMLYAWKPEHIQIIGNIYDNPELI